MYIDSDKEKIAIQSFFKKYIWIGVYLSYIISEQDILAISIFDKSTRYIVYVKNNLNLNLFL